MPYHVVIKFLGENDKELISEEFQSSHRLVAAAVDARLLRMEINNKRRPWKKIIATAEKIGEEDAEGSSTQ